MQSPGGVINELRISLFRILTKLLHRSGRGFTRITKEMLTNPFICLIQIPNYFNEILTITLKRLARG